MYVVLFLALLHALIARYLVPIRYLYVCLAAAKCFCPRFCRCRASTKCACDTLGLVNVDMYASKPTSC
jgi:hypothetical protein